MTFIVPNVPFFQKEEDSLSQSVKLVVLITKLDCAMFTATNLFKGRNKVEKKKSDCFVDFYFMESGFTIRETKFFHQLLKNFPYSTSFFQYFMVFFQCKIKGKFQPWYGLIAFNTCIGTFSQSVVAKYILSFLKIFKNLLKLKIIVLINNIYFS